jgi:RAD51-like protein 2
MSASSFCNESLQVPIFPGSFEVRVHRFDFGAVIWKERTNHAMLPRPSSSRCRSTFNIHLSCRTLPLHSLLVSSIMPPVTPTPTPTPTTTSTSTSTSTTPIPLSLLPLRPSTLSTLTKRGFVTIAELEESKQHGGMANLAAELDISLEEAASLLREVQGCIETDGDDEHDNLILTASDILHSQQGSSNNARSIVTFCRSLDTLLGGGIPLQQVTELAGMPGSGKTQLGMQVAVDAQIPLTMGGVQGETLYIDTEGSFSPERCYSMAQALVSHVQHSVARKRKPGSPTTSPLPSTFTPEAILQGIHVLRVHDETAQTATIHALPNLLEQYPNVRLIIIDSIAFHYRCAPPNQNTNYMQRTKSLVGIASFLGELATTRNLAILIVNQMTTKINANGGSRLVPALGESWAHATTTRLLLQQENNKTYTCRLIKSPNKAQGTATYTIANVGIRDQGSTSSSSSRSKNTVTPPPQPPQPQQQQQQQQSPQDQSTETTTTTTTTKRIRTY